MPKSKKNSTTKAKMRAVYRHLTPETISRLDDFFDFTDPNELRENLIELYHSYIIHQHDSLPTDFGKFAESMSVFFDLLRFADSEKPSSRVSS
jgi:hypothetical protein